MRSRQQQLRWRRSSNKWADNTVIRQGIELPAGIPGGWFLWVSCLDRYALPVRLLPIDTDHKISDIPYFRLLPFILLNHFLASIVENNVHRNTSLLSSQPAKFRGFHYYLNIKIRFLKSFLDILSGGSTCRTTIERFRKWEKKISSPRHIFSQAVVFSTMKEETSFHSTLTGTKED